MFCLFFKLFGSVEDRGPGGSMASCAYLFQPLCRSCLCSWLHLPPRQTGPLNSVSVAGRWAEQAARVCYLSDWSGSYCPVSCSCLLFHISPPNYLALDFTHHHYFGFPSGSVYPVLLSQLQPLSPHLVFLQLIRASPDLHSISLCTVNAWKFPGGLSDPGENIAFTAVREVFEETGVRSEFKSLLSIRQQHSLPGSFWYVQMYIICRHSPLTYDINFSTQECLRCEWRELTELTKISSTTPITSRLARLLLHGLNQGFDKIDLAMEELPAVYSGRFYQLYHRVLPPALKH
ncbi:uncharacterized protein isoform X1 [Salmo salar]|uniref:Nucleoside diphosphate-linked moiety X motif 6 n=1 Tax=Salmo salar TaxID=8030 RepID=A0ABM3ESH1_SALSA|nr:uncharacterized protein LOC106604589 isoform X1 [Salmo salar]